MYATMFYQSQWNNKAADRDSGNLNPIYKRLYKYSKNLFSVWERTKFQYNKAGLLGSRSADCILNKIDHSINEIHKENGCFYPKLSDIASLLRIKIQQMSNDEFKAFLNANTSNLVNNIKIEDLREISIIRLIMLIELSSLTDSDTTRSVFDKILNATSNIYVEYQELIDKLSKPASLDRCPVV